MERRIDMVHWTEGFLPYQIGFLVIFIIAGLLSRKVGWIKKAIQHSFFAEILVRFFTVWMAYVGRAYTESTYFWFVLFAVGFVNWLFVIWVCYEKKERVSRVVISITTFFLLPLSMNLAVYNREVTHELFTPHVFGDPDSARNVTMFLACLVLACCWYFARLKPAAIKAAQASKEKQPSEQEAKIARLEAEIEALKATGESWKQKAFTLRDLLKQVRAGAKRHLDADNAKLDEVGSQVDALFNEAEGKADEALSFQDALRNEMEEKM
jgi:hypothetical protein